MMHWFLVLNILLLCCSQSLAQPRNHKPEVPVIYAFRPQSEIGLKLPESLAQEFQKMLVAELVGSGKWRYLPHAPDIRIARRDESKPTNELQKLREIGKLLLPLGVDFFAIPRIVSHRVIAGKHPRSQATVCIWVYDAITGSLVNGAIATGTSPGKQDLHAAIRKALIDAVKTVNQYSLLPSHIVRGQGDRWEIGAGSKSQYQPGMELMVARDGRSIGRLPLVSVEQNHSVAVPLQGQPAIGDKVYAVFRLPVCFPAKEVSIGCE